MQIKSWPNLLLAFMTVLCSTVFADQIIQLKDGRQVMLRDDFTWQYVTTESQAAAEASAEGNITGIAAVPIIAEQAIPVAKPPVRYVKVTPGESKNILQLSESGADVLLKPARYENNRLIIPASLTNQGKKSIIKVVISYKLLDQQNIELASGEWPIWISIKRMADTYFRPGTQREGEALKLEVPKDAHYLLQAEVTEVIHR